MLDQSRIGPVLCGDKHDLGDGPPVTVLFTQNTNPVSVAPEQNRVKQGFARDDLFICVHEQFMTETAHWPTSCCLQPSFSNMTTCTRVAAISTSCWGRS
jgi:hypothetical protein